MLSCLCVLLLAASALGHTDEALDSQWEQWKVTYSKEYNSPEDEAYRRGIWEENVRVIEAHNKEAAEGKHSYTVGMNHMGDLTSEEVSERMSGLLLPMEGAAPVRDEVTQP